jgi:hypothetical protein
MQHSAILHPTTLHPTTLHPTTLHYTSLHFTLQPTTLHTSANYTSHFTQLHFTTLIDTSLALIYTSYYLKEKWATNNCRLMCLRLICFIVELFPLDKNNFAVSKSLSSNTSLPQSDWLFASSRSDVNHGKESITAVTHKTKLIHYKTAT